MTLYRAMNWLGWVLLALIVLVGAFIGAKP
jgi:hypothetical protein